MGILRRVMQLYPRFEGLSKPRHTRPVVWLWSSKWKVAKDRGFVEIEVVSFQIDRVLVAAGIVDSRSSAQRLIKGGGVTWRPSESGAAWSKVTDFQWELESGYPILLRVGDGLWRTLMVEQRGPHGKPVTKPQMFPSVAEVMRPREGQTIQFWSKLWRD
jgi:hypothetical protein